MQTKELDFDFDAARVKRIRILLGESQEEFARRLGTGKNTISGWERGEHIPQSGRIIRALLLAEQAAGQGQ